MVNALQTTVSEEIAIAADAIIGERETPSGRSAPAAAGMQIQL